MQIISRKLFIFGNLKRLNKFSSIAPRVVKVNQQDQSRSLRDISSSINEQKPERSQQQINIIRQKRNRLIQIEKRRTKVNWYKYNQKFSNLPQAIQQFLQKIAPLMGQLRIQGHQNQYYKSIIESLNDETNHHLKFKISENNQMRDLLKILKSNEISMKYSDGQKEQYPLAAKFDQQILKQLRDQKINDFECPEFEVNLPLGERFDLPHWKKAQNKFCGQNLV